MTFRDEAALRERIAAAEAALADLEARAARARAALADLVRASERRRQDVERARARRRRLRVAGFVAGALALGALGATCAALALLAERPIDVGFEGQVVRSARRDVTPGARCTGEVRAEGRGRCTARVVCAGVLVYHGGGACDRPGDAGLVEFADTRVPGAVFSEAARIAGIRSRGGEVELDVTAVAAR
jgi:hypothetical protein